MSRLTMPEKLADMQRMSTWNAFFLLVALLLAPGCDGVRQAPQTPPDRDRAGSPSWSPDGSRIIFYSEHDGNAEIYVMDVDGANRTRLTNHPADEGYPAFSPDGQRISFDSDRDESSFEIYTMNAETGRTNINSPMLMPLRWGRIGFPSGRLMVSTLPFMLSGTCIRCVPTVAITFALPLTRTTVWCRAGLLKATSFS